MDFVVTDMDKGMHTGMILIDFQKVFDTLDHKTPLDFKTPVIKCFESYLSNKNFFVSVVDAFLEAGISNFGVHQGSILGPFLFLIYVSYLHLIMIIRKLFLSLC